jgi:muramoyltetrapeptide carboxypeptidase LdcA involved in peptidoglycan recycling
MLRHNIEIPTLDQFENIILFTETSEEIPSSDYVHRVYRALGERGILENIKGILVGRAKAWNFDNQNSENVKKEYRKKQQETILEVVRKYNKDIPVVQNLDFGHTDPNIPLPYGGKIKIISDNQKIFAEF